VSLPPLSTPVFTVYTLEVTLNIPPERWENDMTPASRAERRAVYVAAPNWPNWDAFVALDMFLQVRGRV
jgi:hypothetical protein